MTGTHQQLTLHAWPSELPHSTNKTIAFKWEPKKWYTMKLTVIPKGKTALLQGKVWPKGEPEPEKWTVELEDALPNTNGAPGIFAPEAQAVVVKTIAGLAEKAGRQR